MQIRKAVIPTAGLGTRFVPITRAVPKSMLPIINRPTVDYIIDEVVAAGIEEVIIITSHNSDVIEKHFAENKELEERLLADGKKELYDLAVGARGRVKTTFVKQNVQNGLAGALLCAEEAIGGEPFALLLGDEIIYTPCGAKPCIKQLCDCYETTGKSVIATMAVCDAEVSKYGNLGIKTDGAIKTVYAMKEKPQPENKLSNYAIIGRYALAAEVFTEIKKLSARGNEIVLTEALERLAETDRLVAAEFDGVRYDVGDKFGYVKANVEFALRDDSLSRKTQRLINSLAKEDK